MRFRSVLTASALIAVGAVTAACGASGSGYGSGSGSGKPASAFSSTAPAAPAAAAAAVKVSDSSLGPILTDQNGRTLYAFLNDKNGTSSCAGTCVATWPALVGTGSAGAGGGVRAALLSQTARAEGTSQATYNKWPLYYYVGDTAAGDVDGQGLDGVWFAVTADGKLVKPAG